MARNVLDEHDAGLYAGGLILTKAVLFLPQFVVVDRVPVDVDAARATPGADREPRRWSPASASSVTLGAARAARARAGLRRRRQTTPRSPTTCGSSRSSAPCSSMLQLLVYSVLARQGQRSVLPGLGGARRRSSASVCTTSTPRAACSPSCIIVDARAARRAARASACVVIRRPRGDRPEPAPTQCAASCQLRPKPTETSSGTVEVGGAAHLLADQRLERLPLARRHLEHELVVDLEQHPRPQPGRRRSRGRR